MESLYYKSFKQIREQHPDMTDIEADTAAPKLESYEEQMFNFIMFLCF